ncbi:MAG: hypothetical protein ACRD4K_00410, partial [Candidatus Acidiferrales bacterium]
GQVRAIAAQKLNSLKSWLASQAGATTDPDWNAHYSFALSQVKQLQEDPKQLNLTRPNDSPEGQPIGSDVFFPGSDEFSWN